ncbi:MAG TPA: HAMP domain-containing histidine kinase [Actinomyces sp.]|nr:HAMP domain-containing sensor histidine kinase [Acidobacteriota bacterium]HHT40358.1 HAMP domain-containing histidine kinase [Actinomyces sp.]
MTWKRTYASTSAQEAWHSTSLRGRLVVLFTAILTVGFAIAGAAMVGIMQAHLVSQVDRELESTAKQLAVATARSIVASVPADVPSNYYIRFTSTEGVHQTSITQDTAERFGTPRPGELLQVGGINPSDSITRPVNVTSTKPNSYWRAVAVPISVNNKPYGVVTVAMPLSGTAETVVSTSRYFALLGLVIVVVGGTASYYLIRHALGPLRRIENVAEQIAAGDLTQRIESEPSGTEVGSLANSLNQMLTQIEHSFEERDRSEQRMRRFVSDASHELRTPLSALRGYGELYRMGGVPDDRVPEVMSRIEAESTRMGNLVEDLLTLARLDETPEIHPEEIDLVKIARDSSFDMRALDASRVVSVIGLGEGEPAPDELLIEADKDQITQVFTNLIGNINRYTPKGTPVEIALGETGGNAIIEIRDHGPGISKEDRDKVFARFYRTDVSRSRASGGSGLGLAIVSSIMALHTGQAELGRTSGGGLTVRLTVPVKQNGKQIHKTSAASPSENE